ncbi:aminoglycoside phosphotransferase (APT) family kinase protein [Amycolatopsis echigonensis]|uniref:Aminoglycoside phosphotransferase (APT) family kinase protein n=1 Tax=Amycolatopsis echigonensis TaxID=2576905 RepID=A0A2N3X1M3_9PSEU|nr:phosphotransferase family protein [Amycolatopsis niigatensis]PKV99994.1 aminoglycoside phosphotransferase (APT) family kinase protein [Amycolatopsis niigatensis]
MTSSARPALDGLDLPALERFFTERVPGFSGRLSAELLEGGRSNLTYLLTDGDHRWVLRRPPLGGLTPSAHDMAREYRVIAALGGSGVPVAHAVEFGDDTVLGVPFSVVDYVEGAVIRTTAQLHALPGGGIERCAYGLVDVLARLHAVEPAAVGLSGFSRPQGYLGRQISRWLDQWTRVRTRPLADLDTLHAKLSAACPAESAASIVHGDYRIDNAILDPDGPGTVRAIVDWELATLGDPLADLGLHLAYSDPAFAPVLAGSAASTSDRLPAAGELAQHYADASGRDLSRLGFYLGLGYFKIAVIAEGIHARFRQGVTRGSGFDSAGDAVAPLVAAGLRATAKL